MKKRDENIVVCARLTTPLMLPDNRTGKCNECGWQVQFRPHAPAGRRMCMQCAGDLIDWNDPELKIAAPPRMLEDLVAYFKRRGS